MKLWKNQNGDIFLKLISWYGEKKEGEPEAYDLIKFRKDGSVWEWVVSRNDFPEEVDEEDYNYYIFYRQ